MPNLKPARLVGNITHRTLLWHEVTDRLRHQLVERLRHRLADRLVHRLAELLGYQLAEKLGHGHAERLLQRLAELLGHELALGLRNELAHYLLLNLMDYWLTQSWHGFCELAECLLLKWRSTWSDASMSKRQCRRHSKLLHTFSKLSAVTDRYIVLLYVDAVRTKQIR